MFMNHEALLRIDGAIWSGLPAETARWSELRRTDPTAFIEAFERATAIRNNLAVVAACSGLRESGPLSTEHVMWLMRALTAHGQFDQAIEACVPLGAGRALPAKLLYELAVALAGEGRFSEALAAAAQALELRPELGPAQGLRVRIEILQDLEKEGGPSGGWDQLRSRLDQYLHLRAHRAAVAALEAFLETPLAEGAVQLDAAMAVAVAAIDLLPPDRSARLLDKVRAQGVDDQAVAPLQGLLDAQQREIEGDWAGAAAQLGLLAGHADIDSAVRSALARNVGRLVLQGSNAEFVTGGKRRIFNLMPFNDEFAMLRIRLKEMGPWVDQFVIVEARETFTGLPKPLWFELGKAEFAAFADKIVHIVIDAFPDGLGNAWARDFYQRDRAVDGLWGRCAPDDLVLLTDADEIVRKSAIDGFDGEIASLTMSRYMFFLNYRPKADARLKRPEGPTGAVLKARQLAANGSSYLRFMFSRHRKDWCALPNAGWHFMSAKSPTAIASKYRSYAHQEHEGPLWRDEVALAKRLARIRGGQVRGGWERCEIDETFPEWIQRRPEELDDLIL